ncbi:MAG: JAB domain-containing protein [Planctomycetes bacterium]|nr:JAB domain-containing protein [Planctomycetota bacterium]
MIKMLETRLDVSHGHVPPGPLRSALDVAEMMRELIGDADREHFAALYLNTRHFVTHVHVVSRGTPQSTVVHPREVFKAAFLANAAALVVVHNHPTGDVRPSGDDRAITERLREAGQLLGIELLDSVIVGPVAEFYSAVEGCVMRLAGDKAAETRDGS